MTHWDGRHGPAGDEEALEARLRKCFASEIAVERDTVPSLSYILLMAKLDELNRKQSRVAAIESLAEILVLGVIAALLTFWWNDATAGLEAMLPLTSHWMSGTTVLGIATGLLALLLFWSKTLAVRD